MPGPEQSPNAAEQRVADSLPSPFGTRCVARPMRGEGGRLHSVAIRPLLSVVSCWTRGPDAPGLVLGALRAPAAAAPPTNLCKQAPPMLRSSEPPRPRRRRPRIAPEAHRVLTTLTSKRTRCGAATSRGKPPPTVFCTTSPEQSPNAAEQRVAASPPLTKWEASETRRELGVGFWN